MRNRLKELLETGKVAIGAQLRFGVPAELFGAAGFDWVLIDTEHAPQTPTSVQAQLQGVGCTEATSIVRTAKNDPDLIKLYLDMGAMGVVVPSINTAGETGEGRFCPHKVVALPEQEAVHQGVFTGLVW